MNIYKYVDLNRDKYQEGGSSQVVSNVSEKEIKNLQITAIPKKKRQKEKFGHPMSKIQNRKKLSTGGDIVRSWL